MPNRPFLVRLIHCVIRLYPFSFFLFFFFLNDCLIWFIISVDCFSVFAISMNLTRCGVPPSLRSSISHLTNFDSILNNAPVCYIITASSVYLSKVAFTSLLFLLNSKPKHQFLVLLKKCYAQDVPPALTCVC